MIVTHRRVGVGLRRGHSAGGAVRCGPRARGSVARRRRTLQCHCRAASVFVASGLGPPSVNRQWAQAPPAGKPGPTARSGADTTSLRLGLDPGPLRSSIARKEPIGYQLNSWLGLSVLVTSEFDFTSFKSLISVTVTVQAALDMSVPHGLAINAMKQVDLFGDYLDRQTDSA